MGGSELVPIPVFRLPGRREFTETGTWRAFFGEMVGYNAYDYPKSVRIHSFALGCFRLALVALVFVGYMTYSLYVTKAYLEIAPTFGMARLQLQQPVRKCNPLKVGCKQNLTSFYELPYCSQNPGRKTAIHYPCKNYDQFESHVLESQSNKVMLPTRHTLFTQQILCDGTTDDCDQMYQNIDHKTMFSANIEGWTLLIDHGFTCDELGIALSSWDMHAFYRECLGGSVTAQRGEEEEEDCSRIPIEVDGEIAKIRSSDLTPELAEEIRENWAPGVREPEDSPFYEIPNGDVLRVGDLLKMLEIDLDEVLTDGSHKGSTLRQEGFVLIIEIEYINFKEYSLPNSLPPIYTYSFKVAPIGEFKVSNVHSVSPDNLRIIDDRHGIYFTVVQRGTIGKCSTREVVIMVVEFSILLSIVKWITTFVALNMYSGKPGDKFEHELHSRFDLADGDLMTFDQMVTGELDHDSSDPDDVRRTFMAKNHDETAHVSE